MATQGFSDFLMGLLIRSIYLGMLPKHKFINRCPQPVLGHHPILVVFVLFAGFRFKACQLWLKTFVILRKGRAGDAS